MASPRGDGCRGRRHRGRALIDLLCELASPWGLLACGVAFLGHGAEVVSVATRYWVSALWPLVGKTVDRARGS